VVDIRIIAAAYLFCQELSPSFEVASEPEASVSVSAALRRGKKFQVMIYLWKMLNADDILVCTADF
jgi:hypothetical protein